VELALCPSSRARMSRGIAIPIVMFTTYIYIHIYTYVTMYIVYAYVSVYTHKVSNVKVRSATLGPAICSTPTINLMMLYGYNACIYVSSYIFPCLYLTSDGSSQGPVPVAQPGQRDGVDQVGDLDTHGMIHA
jgi:hypothetical protein